MIRPRTFATTFAAVAIALTAGAIACAPTEDAPVATSTTDSAEDIPMATSTTDPADAPNLPARYHIPMPVGPSMQIIYLGPGLTKYARFTITGISSGMQDIELDLGEQQAVDGYGIKLVDIRGTENIPSSVAHLVITDPTGNRI